MDIIDILIHSLIFGFLLGGIFYLYLIESKYRLIVVILITILYMVFVIDRYFYRLSGPLKSQAHHIPKSQQSVPPVPPLNPNIEPNYSKPDITNELNENRKKLNDWANIKN